MSHNFVGALLWFPLGVSDLLTAISIVVAIVLGVGAIWVALYIYRKQNPRREFSYDVSSSPLVSTEVRGLDRLAVSYDGMPLKYPYLVTIEVASTGRADIPSASFDGNQPIVFELNVPILGEIEQTVSLETVRARLTAKDGQSFVELAPSLLPKGFSIRASYLCDGKPRVEPMVELADIPTLAGTRRVATNMWVNFGLGAVTAASVGLGAGAAAIFQMITGG